VVAGALRPALLVPEGFARGAEADIVFLHELAHLRRRDPLVTLLGDLTTACFWFNPIVHRAARRLRELQELAADSHVLRGGVQASRYARFLVDAFRELTRRTGVPVPHAHPILGECLLETRVRAILDPRGAHRAPSPALTASIVLVFALLGCALAWAPAALQARGLLTQQSRPAAGLDRSLLDATELDRIVRPVFIDHMADRYIAGAAISVVHDGELVYRAGFGRREVFHEVPVEPERTIWRIGSITKVMTGVAVLQLVDRGLLDLDADVDDYLSDLEVPATFEQPVRVRHLLTHTAGFDQIGLGRHAASREEVRPLAEFLDEYLVRIRPPGVVSTYDTYGITLAGHLVEQVTGLSYEEYLKRHVFEPLDMHRSGIVIPPALEDDVATGYGFAGHWEAAEWEFMNTDPASTVSSTVLDMARFAIMLLEEGRYRGRQVLSERSAHAMLTRQWTNHPDQPGFGFTFWEDRSYGIPAFSHGGSMEGFGSFLFLVPEHDLGIFIASNQESGSLANAVLTALVDALFPGRPQTPDLRPRLDGPVDVSPFTGTYANSMHHHTKPEVGWKRQPFELEADDRGRLVFQGEPAFAVGPLAFQRDDGLLITFRENEQGEIEYMFVNQSVYEKLD
jgi:CubicO group peptidase (beta-lactamase class C family)